MVILRMMRVAMMTVMISKSAMVLPVVMMPYKAGHQIELFYKGGKCVDESSPPLEIVWAEPHSTQNGLDNDDEENLPMLISKK